MQNLNKSGESDESGGMPEGVTEDAMSPVDGMREETAASAASVASTERHVSIDEFEKLAISNRRMVRLDRHEKNLRGLRDLDTGETFYAEVAHHERV